MKQKPIKAVLGIATMGLLGAKMLSDKKKKKAIKAVSPVAMLADVTKPEDKNQVTTGQQTARKGKMMKAYKGDMAKGYGAARTQGQGLQDENFNTRKVFGLLQRYNVMNYGYIRNYIIRSSDR